MLHGSYIEISAPALKNNIEFLKTQIGCNVEFCSVIKGNAYGHGIETIVPLAEQCGISCFAVFSADEALKAMKARTQESEIIVMGDIDDDQLSWAIINGISFYIFDNKRLATAIGVSERVDEPAKIHLEVETGLNRTGLQEAQIKDAVNLIKDAGDKLILEGVCTHLAGAESVGNYFRIQHQIETFRNVCDWIDGQGITAKRRHAASSAAAFRYPDTVFDMTRIGIAQYGFWPSQEIRMHYVLQHEEEEEEAPTMFDPLIRVLKWKSRIINIKMVGRGQFVGYGNSYLAKQRRRIAAVPVGYYHGFSRDRSNLGHVLVKGQRAPVVGTVNMNMMTIDVSEIHGVEVGDEIVVIGRQQNDEITVGAFSDLTRDLNYEVLARLAREIPRIIVE